MEMVKQPESAATLRSSFSNSANHSCREDHVSSPRVGKGSCVMKTLSACTIAIAATLLLSLFTIPERAYAQQLPCGLSAWPTGSFTLYVTESAQFNTFGFSVSTLLDQTNYSEQGTGQKVMPALSLNGGSYTSSAQTTGTGSASLTYDHRQHQWRRLQ